MGENFCGEDKHFSWSEAFGSFGFLDRPPKLDSHVILKLDSSVRMLIDIPYVDFAVKHLST